MSKLQELRNFLTELAPGPVKELDKVEHLLAASWTDLAGNGGGGMEPRKIVGRTENMTWNGVALDFQIERHGATVHGSVYAGVQTWRIDLQNATANLDGGEMRRLVGKRAKPLKIEPLVRDIEELILHRKDDSRLKWLSPTCVRIKISNVIPATNAQTTSARRRRLRNALWKRLNIGGWQQVMGKRDTFSL
jgi:hypothetical protein